MADVIDITTEREADILSAAIANRTRYVGVSAHECFECGDKIPQGRREAVKGVQLCVECAE